MYEHKILNDVVPKNQTIPYKWIGSRVEDHVLQIEEFEQWVWQICGTL